MQTIASIMAAKERQYGRSYIPKDDRPARPTDVQFDQAKEFVDALPGDFSQAFAKGIDDAIATGTISDPRYEERGAKSNKTAKTLSDMKYWGWIKSGLSGASERTSLTYPTTIHGFEIELVMYEGKDKATAWYALFDNRRNLVYRKLIGRQLHVAKVVEALK